MADASGWTVTPPADNGGWTLSQPQKPAARKQVVDGWEIAAPEQSGAQRPSAAFSGQDAESSFAEIADVRKVNAAANRAAEAANAKIGETLAPLRKGVDKLPERPATAPSRVDPHPPIEDIDARAVFERLKARGAELKAKGIDPKTDPEYREMARKQATGIRQNLEEAATIGAPLGALGKGIAGLAKRVLPKAGERSAARVTEAPKAAAPPTLHAADPDKFGVKSSGLPAGTSQRVYEIRDPAGAPLGFIDAEIGSDGTARIRDIVSAKPDAPREGRALGANTFGAAAVRDLLRQFRKDNPTVTRIVGERVSGARRQGAHGLEGSGESVGVDLPPVFRPGAPPAGAGRPAARPMAATTRRAGERAPKRPLDLLDFLASRGGLVDQGGELSARDAHRKVVPGGGMLVRKKGGMTLDHAREVAEEAGYLQPGSDINDLLSAIDDSLRGARRFSDRDETAASAWREHQDQQRRAEAPPELDVDELHHRAQQLGIEPRADVSTEELLADIHEREAIAAEGEARAPHADHIEAEAHAQASRVFPEARNELPWFDEAATARQQPAAQPAAPGLPREEGRGPEGAAREAPGRAPSGAVPGRRGEPAAAGGGAKGPPGGIAAPPGGPPARRPPPSLPPSTLIPPRGLIDDFRRIFSPAKRGEAAQATAGMMREAMARREQEFQRAAENLRGFGREMGKLSPRQRLDFMDAIETGNLTPYDGHPLGGLAREIRRLFDERYRLMTERRIEPGYVENYLPHIWADPAAAANLFQRGTGRRSLEGSKAFKKPRTFATVREGIDAGLRPVTDNPIEMSLLQLYQMNKYITAQDVIAEMEAGGLAARVPHDEHPPAGWIAIDDKIARKGNATLYAPEPAATIVNRALSPGLAGTPIYDLVRSAGNMMNSAQLGISGFHAVFVSADAATSAIAKGVKQISRGEPGEIVRGFANIARSPSAPVMAYLRGRKVMKQYVGRGQYGPEMERIVDSLIAGGGRAKMDSFYRGSFAGSFWQAMRGSLMRSSGRTTLGQELAQMFRDAAPITVRGVPIVPGAVRAAAQLVPRVMDTIMAPLMEDYVPKIKLGVFYDLMSDELRRNPAMTRPQLRAAAGRLWDSVDNRLGQLAYDNLFWNRTMKDVGHIAVRSLGWNLGTLRELAGGALDLTKGRDVASGAGRQLTDRASYVVAMPIATAMMGGLYAYLKGTWRPDQPLKDWFFPKTGGTDAQGGENRVSMPGYFKDVYEWSTQPEQTVKGKIHPLWTTVYEMMNNEKWNGAAITDTRQGLGLPAVKDYSTYLMQQFSPLSLRPPPNTPAESGISATERFFGVREAPYRVREPERSEGFDRRVISRKVVKGQKTGTEYSK